MRKHNQAVNAEIDRLPVARSFNAIDNYLNFERLFCPFQQSRLPLR